MIAAAGGQEKFVKQSGVPKRTLASYAAGKSEPKASVLKTLARTGNVSIEWLMGISDDPAGGVQLVELPRYEVEASAGGGKAVLAELPDNHLRISEDWFGRHAPRNAHLGVIDIVGDSMWPTLLDGDLAVVNFDAATPRHLAGGGIFVFTVGDDLYVKRMVLQPDRKLIAASDNPEYPPYTFDMNDEHADVIVHGKVVWTAGEPRPFGGRNLAE